MCLAAFFRVAALVMTVVFAGPLSAMSMPVTAPTAGTWRLDLRSLTVAQSVTDATQGPRSLITTYYQAEWWWRSSTWFGLQTELEGGQVLGHGQTEHLGTNLGSQWRLNEMQEDPTLYVPVFYFFGSTPDKTLSWRVGRLAQDGVFDDNRAARAKRTKFIGMPFFRNTAVAFSSKGLGGAMTWEMNPHAALILGAGDANAVGTKAGFTTWRGEWFRGAELTVHPLPDASRAAVRLLGWGTERAGVHDGGWGISADWEASRALVLFSRVGGGSERLARSRRFVSGGVAWEKPFGRATDFLALGVARGEALQGGLHPEVMGEIVYRWQVNRVLALSPDIQYVYHPARSRLNHSWVFGLRCAIAINR